MRVVLVEDQGLLLDALAHGLAVRGIDVVGRAGNRDEAIRAVNEHKPEVAVLDIRLPPSFTDEGLKIAEEIRSRFPDVAVLVLSSYAEVAYAERLLSMQENSYALGYLLKQRVGNLGDLADALHRVAAGEVLIDSIIIDRLMRRRRRQDPLDALTPHERRILALVAEGRSNRGIAQRLGCQVSTVERHLTTITDKLGLATVHQGERRHVNVRVLAALAFLRGAEPQRGGDEAEGPALP